MSKLSRRELLKHGGQAGLALGAAGLLGCSPPTPCPIQEAPDTPTEQAARVAVVQGSDLAEMAREALAAVGGASSFIHPGETVFIKPNFGAVGMVKYNPITKGDSVKPELVFAVAEECLKAGASMVTIGEGGQVPEWDWYSVPTLDGATSVGAEADRLRQIYGDRIALACLNTQSPAWDTVPSLTCLGQVEASSLALRADRVISLPVIKSHRWTMMTGGIKNLFGLTSVTRYSSPLISSMRAQLHDAGLHQVIVDIAKAVQPAFTIMDCSIGCEGNGPHVLPGWWGTSVDVRERLGSWMLLAGPDALAVDATTARTMGLDPLAVEHLSRAYHQGLGQIREELIELSGAALRQIRMNWQPAQLTEGFLEVMLPGLHLLTDA